MSRAFWDSVGHKSTCPTWGDEDMIERCTCDDGRRFREVVGPRCVACPTCGARPLAQCRGGWSIRQLCAARIKKANKLSAKNEQREKDMNKRQELAALERRRDALVSVEEKIQRLQEELANRPEEPPVDSVVAFRKVFERDGKSYDWVAFRAHGDWWYLSQDGARGARLPRMNWDDLLDFIGDNEIYIVSEWDKL